MSDKSLLLRFSYGTLDKQTNIIETVVDYDKLIYAITRKKFVENELFNFVIDTMFPTDVLASMEKEEQEACVGLVFAKLKELVDHAEIIHRHSFVNYSKLPFPSKVPVFFKVECENEIMERVEDSRILYVNTSFY